MTGPTVIELPEPSLVVLVGAAGAGKSTFAARHFAPDEVLSSDAFRAAIAGDPGDQAATRPAFSALHRSLVRRLAQGRLTVVDATSVKRASRLDLLRRARAAGDAGRRDRPRPAGFDGARAEPGSSRARGPREAVDAQLADLAAALRPGGLDAEGFAAIYRLTDAAAVDAVEIRRVPRT